MLIKLRRVDFENIGYPHTKNHQKRVADIFVNPEYVSSVRQLSDMPQVQKGEEHLICVVCFAGGDQIWVDGSVYHISDVINGKTQDG